MNIHIETERLILRDIEEYDVEGIFALDSDPDVHEYLGKKPIKTIQEAKKVIDNIRNHYVRNGIGRWAIVDKITQDFIGWTGLKYEEEVRTDYNYYDIGYRLRKKYWGQGIGTESAKASLNYGFETLNLNEIEGAAHVNNIGSNKILQTLGLKFVETFEYDNELHNWYKIEKSEWLNSTKART